MPSSAVVMMYWWCVAASDGLVTRSPVSGRGNVACYSLGERM